MDAKQNPVATAERYIQATPERLAAIFPTQTPTDATVQRRQNVSMLAELYTVMLNSGQGEFDSLIAPLTAKGKETAKLHVTDDDGNEVPATALEVEMSKRGYRYGSIKVMLSAIRKMRDAYRKARFVPEQGTTWNEAYNLAKEVVSDVTAQAKKEKARNAPIAYNGAHIAQEMEKLSDEDLADPAKIAEATQRGIQAAQQARTNQIIAEAVGDAWNKVGPKNANAFIAAFTAKLQDWQTAQSSKTVAPAEVPAAQEDQQQTAEFRRAVNQ